MDQIQCFEYNEYCLNEETVKPAVCSKGDRVDDVFAPGLGRLCKGIVFIYWIPESDETISLYICLVFESCLLN